MSSMKDLAPCPVCRGAVSPESDYLPFCSKRCQQIDLARWAGGDYRIAGEQAMPWGMNDSDEPKPQ